MPKTDHTSPRWITAKLSTIWRLPRPENYCWQQDCPSPSRTRSHSTGHSTRLNRKLGNGFGSAEYAYEELIAELSSLIVTLTLGGEFKPDLVAEENANSVAYLQSWLKACKEQDKALNKAFSDAQESADFILATMEGDAQ